MSDHATNDISASMMVALRLLATNDTLTLSINRISRINVPFSTGRALVRRGLAYRDSKRRLTITDAGRAALGTA